MFGGFKHKESYVTETTFKTRLEGAAQDKQDGHYFKKVRTDELAQSIYVVEVEGGKEASYTVHAGRGFINELHKGQFINSSTSQILVNDAFANGANVSTSGLEGTIPPKDHS